MQNKKVQYKMKNSELEKARIKIVRVIISMI